MTKIKNTVAYVIKTPLALTDYAIGTNSEDNGVGMAKGQSISMQMTDIRNVVIAGLSPEIGGTLKIAEIEYTGVLTSPADVANALDPVHIVSRYEVLFFNVNGNKYLLTLQDVTIGDGEANISDSDFLTTIAFKKLGDGTNILKGYNTGTGEQEFYALKSTGIDISIDTGNIVIENKAGTSVGDAGVNIYKGLNATTKLHEIRKAKSTGFDVTIDGDSVRFEKKAGSNLGDGIAIYKGLNSTTKVDEFYNLKSSTLTISKEIDGGGDETGNILIEAPSIPGLYVNNLYKPTYEDFLNPDNLGKGEGTLAKPFTDTRTYTNPTTFSDAPNTAIQNAKDAYEGGNPLSPALSGQTIVIQNNVSGYTFAGNLSSSNIKVILEEGAVVLSSTTGKLLDMDNASYFNQTNASALITLKADSVLQISGDGIFNSGNNQAGTTYATGKTINILGDGLIFSTTNNITKYIINSDVSNTGNNNDGNLTFDIKCKIRADYQGVYRVGGASRIDVYNRLSSGNLSNAVDTSLKAFHQTGGQVRLFNGAILEFQGLARTNAITFEPSGVFEPSFFSQQGVFAGVATNLFNKLNNSDVILEVTNSASGYGIGLTEIFESTNLWEVRFNQNVFNSGNIDVTKADLTKGNTVASVNFIGFDVIESLMSFASKQDAKDGVVPINGAYLVLRDVAAADLQPSTEYRVKTAGSPPIGTVGNYIIATGSETGTGVGTIVERCVMA